MVQPLEEKPVVEWREMNQDATLVRREHIVSLTMNARCGLSRGCYTVGVDDVHQLRLRDNTISEDSTTHQFTRKYR